MSSPARPTFSATLHLVDDVRLGDLKAAEVGRLFPTRRLGSRIYVSRLTSNVATA